jgi:hypothetical protein
MTSSKSKKEKPIMVYCSLVRDPEKLIRVFATSCMRGSAISFEEDLSKVRTVSKASQLGLAIEEELEAERETLQ